MVYIHNSYRQTDLKTDRQTDRNQKTDRPTESTVKSFLNIFVQCGIPAGSQGIPQDPTPNASVRLPVRLSSAVWDPKSQ